MTPTSQVIAHAIGPVPERFSRLPPSLRRLLEACPAERMPVQKAREPAPATEAMLALQQHLAAHYAQLHRRLERYLGCPDFASECLHDAWLRLGERRLREVPANPEAYIYRVACNLAMDAMRSRKRWTGMNEEGADIDMIADARPGPELIAEARSEVASVDRAMQRLPHRQRAVLLALRWHEMSRQEVAARHGVSVRNVDTALRQALGALR